MRHGVATGLAVWLVVAAGLPAQAANDETRRRVRFNQGIVAFHQRDYPAAQRLFTDLVREDPADVAALYWLGMCQLQRSDYAAASTAFEKVMQLAPDRVEAKLDAAMALAGQERYQQSADLLGEFLASGAGDETARTLAHFFLGVAEYETGRYDPALASLQSAEAGTTDSQLQANIAWYRGWILTEQRRFEEAAVEFRRVGELSKNVDQAARARSLAEQVASGVVVEEQISPLQFRLDLGSSYDTNVILLGDDTSLPVGLSSDDDFRFGLSTDVRYVHPLADKWLLGIGGSTFHSWHASLQEFNVQSYGGRVFLNYFADARTTLGLQYEYDYSLVNNGAFLTSHRISPSARFIETFHDDGTPLTATTLFYSFEPRNYREELNDLREDRDGRYHQLGLTQSFNIYQPRLDQNDPRWLSAAVGYRFLDESTQGDDFDMTGNAVTAGLAMPLPLDLSFEFSGQWTWEDYWQINSRDYRARNRHDFVQRYIWSIGRQFNLDRNISMAIRGEIAWTADDSNIRNRLKEAIYSYDRVIYGLTLSFAFN